MSPRQVELALKKQRLQMRSTALREDFSTYAAGWKPVFTLADRGYSGLRWLRRHPVVPVAAGVALLVARPRMVLRWAQRGFFAWQTLRRLRGVLPLTLRPIR
ncbi:MAG: YqjK-like family protein [Proteobacteria bacterium]|nr:YqjK-like family protein [Pseudomonadota bacterium]